MAAKEVERKLRRGLDVLGLDAEAALPYLLHLLGQPVNGALDGVAAEVVGIRTRDTILGLLRERCRMSPTLMCVEDLHWIDSASEEVLVRAMEDRDKLPLMILCTYRPPIPAAGEGTGSGEGDRARAALGQGHHRSPEEPPRYRRPAGRAHPAGSRQGRG